MLQHHPTSRTHTRNERLTSSVRFRNRRRYGRPWLEILAVVGIIVIFAAAGSTFLNYVRGLL